MKPEVYFLRYAFTCAHIIKEKGKITSQQLSDLERAAVSSTPMPRDYLESIFPRAFEKIDIVADELKSNRWDIEVLTKYFRVRHNDMLRKGEYEFKEFPQSARDLCMVHEGEVTGIRKLGDKQRFLVVEYNGYSGKSKRFVSDMFIPQAKVHDRVTIHYGHAVEKI